MYVVAIGEIFLKGQKKGFFIKRLLENMIKELNLKKEEIRFENNRILILKEIDEKALRRIFGIIFYAKARQVSFEEIEEVALSFIKEEKTFRVSAKRLVKVYKSSEEINREVGAFILGRNPGLKVKLKDPEVEIFIEIEKESALVYTKREECLGGLPVGVSGEVFLEGKNEKTLTVAGFLLMKRGLQGYTKKELPLLKKFGVRIEEKEGLTHATDEIFENLKIEKEGFVLKPLVGFSEEELEELYTKIKAL